MTPPSLPPALAAALDARAQGMSRIAAAKRQTAMSDTYRAGGGSAAITSEADALAYALARMPATYAAVAAALNALAAQRPDFAPDNLLDCGAGPGTASFAAAQAFTSLRTITLIDSNPALRALAMPLLAETLPLLASDYVLRDAPVGVAAADAADLVIASYVVNELPEPARVRLVEALWAKTRDTLLIVEPGTPDGYARIIALRARLIAQGAYVLAPCPHENACPLSPPDWCHFVQRLPRSRAHIALKQAERPFEDEKFSYVALSRVPPTTRRARVLAQPHVGKVEVAAKLCTPAGLVAARIARRDKAAYAQAKRWSWGDGVAFASSTEKPSS